MQGGAPAHRYVICLSGSRPMLQRAPTHVVARKSLSEPMRCVAPWGATAVFYSPHPTLNGHPFFSTEVAPLLDKPSRFYKRVITSRRNQLLLVLQQHTKKSKRSLCFFFSTTQTMPICAKHRRPSYVPLVYACHIPGMPAKKQVKVKNDPPILLYVYVCHG